MSQHCDHISLDGDGKGNDICLFCLNTYKWVQDDRVGLGHFELVRSGHECRSWHDWEKGTCHYCKKSLPDAIICDIDGTLAHMNGRTPYEWDKIDTDIVDVDIRDLIFVLYEAGTTILLVSGRDGCCEDETEEWLIDNDVPHHELWMRDEGDNRKDSIVKRELYEKYIEGKYLIRFVLDDRNQMVDMWRNELGLKCLQVAEGNF
jgi:hypothetical protein